MPLFRPKYARKSKATNAHSYTVVGEHVYRSDEKLTANLGKEERAIAAFLQPLRITHNKLLNLGLRKAERIECQIKPAKHLLETAVSNHFVHSDWSFLGQRSWHIVPPIFKVGIDVAENICSPSESLVTISLVQDQDLAFRNQ